MRTLATLALAGLACATTLAQTNAPRRDGPFEYSACYSGTVETITLNDRLAVRTTRIAGSAAAAEPGGPFDGQAIQCSVIAVVQNGHSNASGYCLQQDGDGDRWMFKLEDIDRAGRIESIGGTGKYEGMRLSGRFEPRGRPVFIAPGTVQICQRIRGQFGPP